MKKEKGLGPHGWGKRPITFRSADPKKKKPPTSRLSDGREDLTAQCPSGKKKRKNKKGR